MTAVERRRAVLHRHRVDPESELVDAEVDEPDLGTRARFVDRRTASPRSRPASGPSADPARREQILDAYVDVPHRLTPARTGRHVAGRRRAPIAPSSRTSARRVGPCAVGTGRAAGACPSRWSRSSPAGTSPRGRRPSGSATCSACSLGDAPLAPARATSWSTRGCRGWWPASPSASPSGWPVRCSSRWPATRSPRPTRSRSPPGAYVAVTAVAAFGLSVPAVGIGFVAFGGGLWRPRLVLALAGAARAPRRPGSSSPARRSPWRSSRATATLLSCSSQETTGLFAWGSGTLSQLGLDGVPAGCARWWRSATAGALLSRGASTCSASATTPPPCLGVPVPVDPRVVGTVIAVVLTRARGHAGRADRLRRPARPVHRATRSAASCRRCCAATPC